jgi:hypothetical protein
MKYWLPPVAATEQPPAPLGADVVLLTDKLFSRDPANLRSDEERALLALIDGKRTVGEILKLSPLSQFVAMRQLRSLSQRRIVRSVSPSRPPTGPVARVPSTRLSTRLGLTQNLTAAADMFVEGKAAPVPPSPITVELVPVKSTAIANRPAALPLAPPRALRSGASQQAVELWFSLTKRDWSTLVVVPGHRLGSALPLACALVEAGSAIRRQTVELFSAEGKDLIPTTDWIFPRQPGDQFRRVIALDPVSVNPMGIPVAQGAQAVLIVADRGQSDLATVRRTVEAIGRDRIIGSVLMSEAKPIKLR